MKETPGTTLHKYGKLTFSRKKHPQRTYQEMRNIYQINEERIQDNSARSTENLTFSTKEIAEEFAKKYRKAYHLKEGKSAQDSPKSKEKLTCSTKEIAEKTHQKVRKSLPSQGRKIRKETHKQGTENLTFSTKGNLEKLTKKNGEVYLLNTETSGKTHQKVEKYLPSQLRKMLERNSPETTTYPTFPRVSELSPDMTVIMGIDDGCMFITCLRILIMKTWDRWMHG